MKRTTILIASFFLITSGFTTPSVAQTEIKFRHIPSEQFTETASATDEPKSTQEGPYSTRVRDIDEILASLGTPDFKPTPINKVFGPWVFLGYRSLQRKHTDLTLPMYVEGIEVISGDSVSELVSDSLAIDISDFIADTLGNDSILTDSLSIISAASGASGTKDVPPVVDMRYFREDYMPKFLKDALTSYRIQEDFMYETMVTEPKYIDYSYWDLPVPPRLLDDDVTFAGYIRRLNLPEVDQEKAVLPEDNVRHIHWLHNVGSSLQFSQAFVSKNWYQGGNNHLALLFNIYWNVQLNQVFHPNYLVQSSLSYKLGLNSTPQDEVHAYSISEDVLQYNLNAGLKAFKKWFYSFNMQAKTQILRNYEQNSMKRKASFMSPGDLNLGLGMAYSSQNKKKTFQFTATISPISYNLKTCITDKIDHEQFNISPGRRARSEIGSNGEFNMVWQMTHNINYRTRMFLFTDYKYFLADWENTFSFEINRFLSTQIYLHMRYDTSSDMSTSWKHFMLREVLSFGLSYTFSTKP